MRQFLLPYLVKVCIHPIKRIRKKIHFCATKIDEIFSLKIWSLVLVFLAFIVGWIEKSSSVIPSVHCSTNTLLRFLNWFLNKGDSNSKDFTVPRFLLPYLAKVCINLIKRIRKNLASVSQKLTRYSILKFVVLFTFFSTFIEGWIEKSPSIIPHVHFSPNTLLRFLYWFLNKGESYSNNFIIHPLHINMILSNPVNHLQSPLHSNF